jgi:integrase
MAGVSKRKPGPGKDSKARYRVSYYDRNKKRRNRSFPTKKLADAFKLKVEVELSQGVHTPDGGSFTVKQAGDAWIETAENNGLERSTIRPYRNHMDLHIGPLIGHVKLSRLTTPDVERFKDDLLKTRSRAMVKKVLGSLKMLLSDAQRVGNVAQNVALPVTLVDRGREKTKVEIPTKQELNGLVGGASSHGDGVRALLVTAALSGLRSSELRGLAWSSVDLKTGMIQVDRRADQWGKMGSPKSEAGRRGVPVPGMVVNALREWKTACPKGLHDLVFPNGVGKVESHSNIVNRIFNPIQLGLGLHDESVPSELSEDGLKFSPLKARYGFHSLRHFYASLIIEEGFIPKRVQELMGHSTIQMTMDTYGHLFTDPEGDRSHLKSMEAGLLAAGKTRKAR